MFDVIKAIIDHDYISGSAGYGDQQYIYYIAGAVIVVLLVVFIDVIRDIFCGFFRG